MPSDPVNMRIDKLLWFLRLAKTRGAAHELAEAGHIRRNGNRVERAAQNVSVGDILVLPLPSGLRIIRILSIPTRRGPALEAQACYRALDETRIFPIAAAPSEAAVKGDLQP